MKIPFHKMRNSLEQESDPFLLLGSTIPEDCEFSMSSYKLSLRKNLCGRVNFAFSAPTNTELFYLMG
jgi:hypothetical protein